MGAAFVPILIVVVLLLVGAVAVRQFGARSAAQRQQVLESEGTGARSGEHETVRYRIPEGQDPAAVVLTLTRAGFEAVPEAGNTHELVILCPLGGRQREEVRLAIAEAAQTADELDDHPTGAVRFVDE